MKIKFTFLIIFAKGFSLIDYLIFDRFLLRWFFFFLAIYTSIFFYNFNFINKNYVCVFLILKIFFFFELIIFYNKIYSFSVVFYNNLKKLKINKNEKEDFIYLNWIQFRLLLIKIKLNLVRKFRNV